jgi:hypothetical protein
VNNYVVCAEAKSDNTRAVREKKDTTRSLQLDSTKTTGRTVDPVNNYDK